MLTFLKINENRSRSSVVVESPCPAITKKFQSVSMDELDETRQLQLLTFGTS
jgi:hypothetical protein